MRKTSILQGNIWRKEYLEKKKKSESKDSPLHGTERGVPSRLPSKLGASRASEPPHSKARCRAEARPPQGNIWREEYLEKKKKSESKDSPLQGH